jgi:hypothetical protein
MANTFSSILPDLGDSRTKARERQSLKTSFPIRRLGSSTCMKPVSLNVHSQLFACSKVTAR